MKAYLEPKYEADPVDSSAISPIDFAAPGLLLDLLISDEVEVVVVLGGGGGGGSLGLLTAGDPRILLLLLLRLPSLKDWEMPRRPKGFRGGWSRPKT